MMKADTPLLAATSPNGTILYSDEPEMESSLHYLQLMLLVSCLSFYWSDGAKRPGKADRDDYFIGANLTIYYSRYRIRTRDFRGPDFFLVKNTDPRPRGSWAIWEEGGRYPNLIIELLSNSTAEVDRTEKKRLYQNQFRTPEYFWFHPETLEFVGWRLEGESYTEIVPNERGWRWSQELELYLGAIDGKLRYIDADGNVIPTPQEDNLAVRTQAEQYRQQLELERQQSEQYRQQLEQADLARDEAVMRLLALGLTLEQVAASFELTPEEIKALSARLDDSN